MDAARKSYEIQTQVRNNAEEHRNSINDLLSWEKEIKDKEKQMLAQATEQEESSTDGKVSLKIENLNIKDH